MYSKVKSRKIQMLAATVFSIVLMASAAYAADQNNADPDMMAENVLDMSIQTKSGEDVGEITNVLFDRKGKIKEYLVDVGGFLGIGEKTVAVSPDELTYDPDQGYAVFKGSQKDLENRPEADYLSYGYGRGAYPYRPYAGYRSGYGYGYYPSAPLESYGPYGYYDRYPPRGYHQGYDRGYGYDRNADRGMRRQQNQADQQSGQSDRYQSRRQRSPDYGRGYYASPQQKNGEDNRSDISLEALLDADVRTQNGEDVGEIENLVINRRGRITHAIIDVGGFLGIGEKPVAVPFKKLKNIGPYYVMYPGTEEQLESMPAYNRGQLMSSEKNQTQAPKQKNQSSAAQGSEQPAGENQQKNQ